VATNSHVSVEGGRAVTTDQGGRVERSAAGGDQHPTAPRLQGPLGPIEHLLVERVAPPCEPAADRGGRVAGGVLGHVLDQDDGRVSGADDAEERLGHVLHLRIVLGALEALLGAAGDRGRDAGQSCFEDVALGHVAGIHVAEILLQGHAPVRPGRVVGQGLAQVPLVVLNGHLQAGGGARPPQAAQERV